MDLEIHTSPLKLTISGFGGVATNSDHAATAFRLSGKMWEWVKLKGLANKGKNIWVYGMYDTVFAGIELDHPDKGIANGLEILELDLSKYAYFKHVGPYSLISDAGRSMRAELARQRHKVVLPYVEIYGHWTKDESKLETELLIALA